MGTEPWRGCNGELRGSSQRPEALMLETQSSANFTPGDATSGDSTSGVATSGDAYSGDGRPETPLQRLDRNLEELTGDRSEIGQRVTVTGVQVLFAFLLVVPF